MMMLSVTPTKLGDYLTCPRKFEIRHIRKTGGGCSSAAFSFGSSVHRVLQEFMDPRKSKSRLAINPKDLLKRFWETGAYKDEEEERGYFAKGCYALERYCEMLNKEETETIGTEVFMTLILDLRGLKVRLGCKADRVALPPDRTLEITDYKTNQSGQVPSAEFLRGHLPTFLYYVLTRLTYPQYPRVMITFSNVLSLAKTSIRYEKDLVEENKRELWQCLKIIAAGNYAPQMSEECGWCDYRDDCPAAGRIVDYRTI